MALEFTIVVIVMEVAIILLHSLGLYILRCLHRNGKGTAQLMYIMNLSVIEIFINLFYFVVNVLLLLLQFKIVTFDFRVFTYLELAGANTGLILIYYLTMFYILLDKVFEVFWNIKYPVYWTLSKAKYLMFGTDLIGFLFAIGFVIGYSFNNKFEYRKPLTYFYILFNFLFLVTAIASYAYVFFKYRAARSDPTHQRSKKKESVWATFRGSRFYLSTLLIFTFILLVVLPDLIVFFMLTHKNDSAGQLMARRIAPILFHISYMMDAAVYIFMYPPANTLLVKKLRMMKCFRFLKRSRGVRSDDFNLGTTVDL